MLVACVAPGPSLTRSTCDRLAGRCRVLAVSNAYQLTPWADWLYSCDQRWWDVFAANVATDFQGECWTQSSVAAERYGLNHVTLSPMAERHKGLSTMPGVINGGYTSGYQAVNLALHFGATRILLVGYDMRPIDGRQHYFGEYQQKNLAVSRNWDKWAAVYNTIHPPDYGLEIINCTPGSAIRAFPFMDIDDAMRTLSEAA